MQKIGLRAAEKIRHLLNPEQKEKFDRMERAAEQWLEGELERM
jgi:hypothetical protein